MYIVVGAYLDCKRTLFYHLVQSDFDCVCVCVLHFLNLTIYSVVYIILWSIQVKDLTLFCLHFLTFVRFQVEEIEQNQM